jgi:hypothetical protein
VLLGWCLEIWRFPLAHRPNNAARPAFARCTKPLRSSSRPLVMALLAIAVADLVGLALAPLAAVAASPATKQRKNLRRLTLVSFVNACRALGRRRYASASISAKHLATVSLSRRSLHHSIPFRLLAVDGLCVRHKPVPSYTVQTIVAGVSRGYRRLPYRCPIRPFRIHFSTIG